MTTQDRSSASFTTSGATARLVAAALQARSIDIAPIFRRAGLSTLDLSARDLAAPAWEEHRLVEFAAEATDDAAFGLHLIDMVDPRDWGMFFYLLKAAPDVRAALALSVGHMHLANPSINSVLTLEAAGGAAIENGYAGIRRSELKHAIEFAFAFMTGLFRLIAGRAFRLETMSFAHERTTAVDEFERFFGCPVAFGAASDRVTFSRETMELPVLSADVDLLEVLEPLARSAKEMRRVKAQSLHAAVDGELRRLLPIGEASIETVASALGVSTRSLSRRLSSQGATFSDLLDDLRRRLALQHLSEPHLSISQVAYRIGYDQPGTFSNAFRRWTGASPSQARADPALLHKLATTT